MPIYEYRCSECKKKFSALVGMTADSSDPACPHCGAIAKEKLVSRFTRMRNEDERIDEIADRLDMMDNPDSGQDLRELVRDMGKAMDEDLSDEMEEIFEADMEGKLADDDE